MCDVTAPPTPTDDLCLHLDQVEIDIQKLVIWKEMQYYNSQLDAAVDSLVESVMHTLPDTNRELVKDWAGCWVKHNTFSMLHVALKDELPVRASSVLSDRDYLRAVLLNMEKKLETLCENYKSTQKELMHLAGELSQSWQFIEEAVIKARTKRSELAAGCKEVQFHLTELTEKWRSAASTELETLHKTMIPLIMSDAAPQILDFGVVYNDLYCILNVVAQKRLKNDIRVTLPTAISLTGDSHLERLINMNSSEANAPQGYNKLYDTTEWNQNMKTLISTNNQLLHSLRDLITTWWQPPFERAVPEDLIVNGRNILQHTTNWDRITNFVKKTNNRTDPQ